MDVSTQQDDIWAYSRNECVKVFDRVLPVYFPSAERSQNKLKCIFPQNKTMDNDLSMLFSWGANLRVYKTQFAKQLNGYSVGLQNGKDDNIRNGQS